MTSAVPPPNPNAPPPSATASNPQPIASHQQQHHHPHLHNQTQPPTPTAASQAASPPNKRDLKSWWKGFKLPSKHQETHGEAPSVFFPSSYPPPPRLHHRPVFFRRSSLFREDVDGGFNSPSGKAVLQALLVVHHEDNHASLRPAAKSSDSVLCRAWRRSRRLFSCLASPFLRRTPHDRFVNRYKKRARPQNKKTKPRPAETRAPGIFGVPLRQSITYANVAISLVDDNGKSYIYGYVPIVVAKCGVFLKEKATGVEGIFRLSGSEKRIKELKQIFDSPDRYGKGLSWEGYTVHDAANVLRRYLNDLPEPVVPLDLYEKFRDPLRGATKQGAADAEGPQFIDNFDLDGAIARYQQLITELPPLNRQLLLYILDLLAVFAAKADENRMNSQNLAAIFQPGMLSHPAHAMAPEEYRLNQCVIIFLIENQDHFLIGMQGTAADEKTVQEVQQGSAQTNAPATPIPIRKSGVHRSSSNASAGAESVARDGKIRRNRSTSSRHSRHSNGAPSPASPALATTPTGGLGRSNTVPSKKSPALQSGRFQRNRNDHSPGPVTPLTPVHPNAHIPAPPTVEEVATPDSGNDPLATSTGGLPPAASVIAGRSQERLLEPQMEVVTPSRERTLQNLFQRSPTDNSDKKTPNKLRKRRLPGSSNPSAQSSTASLTHSAAASPAVESANPMEQIGEITSGELSIPTPEHRSAAETPSEPTPRASQIPSTGSLQPPSAEQTLKPKNSLPTSLHSSFNEGSDLDQVEEAPTSADAADQPDKEKRRRWRLSRRKEDLGSAPQPGVTSPRKNITTHAEASTSSVGTGSNMARRSFTGESSDPTLISAEALSSQDSGSKEMKDDSKGLTGWIKNKYREAKENREDRRNKSPPADRSLNPQLLPVRGKSIDIKRPIEEEKEPEPSESQPQPQQPLEEKPPQPQPQT